MPRRFSRNAGEGRPPNLASWPTRSNLRACRSSVPPAPTTNPLARIREDLGAERRATQERRAAAGRQAPRASRAPSGCGATRSRSCSPPTRSTGRCSRCGSSTRSTSSCSAQRPTTTSWSPHATNFRWRDGSLGDLIPLIGDGLLTTDGEYHDRARRIMLPAFHRERIGAAADVDGRGGRAGAEGWRPGGSVDLYDWTRRLAMRVAMRALFGFDPDRAGARRRRATSSSAALSFYGRELLPPGAARPGQPVRAAARRRDARSTRSSSARSPAAGATATPARTSSALLMDADDEDGNRLADEQLRDQVMTLLFAGHDTTTSTVSFLFYELARHPDGRAPRGRARPRARRRGADAAQLFGEMPELDMAVDETLRLYPPAWIGPRRVERRVRVRRLPVPGGRPGQLLLLGQPPPARRLR